MLKRRKHLHFGSTAVLCGLLLNCFTSRAQDSPLVSDSPGSMDEDKRVEGEAPSATQDARADRRIEELEKKYRREIAAVEERLQTRIDELLEQKNDEEAGGEAGEHGSLAEQWAAEPAPERTRLDRLLNIYGFLDVTFFRNFLREPNSPAIMVISDKSTFMISNVSVILQSEMTSNLSAMVELRFSFLPNGQERNFNTYIDDSTFPVLQYERTETWQRSSYNTEYFWPGSVMIERAHVTWAPRDWFKVLAGRFLTPFGVWNVEHSPTVIIPVHAPYMQIRRMVPPTQLGLQLFGRFFVRDDTSLEYFVTMSNGRDGSFPTENVDLDNNKALGIGLRATLDKVTWSATVGGYGYYGKSTDIEKSIYIDTKSRSLSGKIQETCVQNEAIASAFLLLQIQRLRLQSEGVLTYVDMEVPRKLTPLDRFFLTGDFAADWYALPSYTGRGLYTLLSYELPLDRVSPILKILPFVLYEYNVNDDTTPYSNQDFFSVGINWRPTAAAALKVEYSLILPKSEEVGGYFHSAAAQLAVSF